MKRRTFSRSPTARRIGAVAMWKSGAWLSKKSR